MEELASAMERLRNRILLVNSLFIVLLSALSLFEKFPAPIQEMVRAHPYAWCAFLLALIPAVVLLWFATAPKSRLLLPDRFVIRAGERKHLKGREGDIRALADQCEKCALVFLEGESGSGKSALARVGIVDECRQRHQLHPIYMDLSGADWENRLPALLAGEVWRSLSESDRQTLGLTAPSPPDEIFARLALFSSRIGRKPLIIFDQFDDYQSSHRRHFREGRESSTWITAGRLTRHNGFWREIARLVEGKTLHCLFITRTDNAGGLDAVRFTEPRIFRLPWVDSNLMAPLLEEITVPETADRPVVAHPLSGWEKLKRRLMRDLTERDLSGNDIILPIRLSVALQALRFMRVLTVGEYQRCGGAEGLERLHIERNIIDAAQASGLSAMHVRQALVSLVEPVKAKTVQLSTSQLLSRLDPGAAAPDDRFFGLLQKALEHLERCDVVRRRAVDDAGDDVWLLHHDFLCRGVIAAERQANRWHALLHERARQFGLSTGVLRRWRTLLTPMQQIRLGLMRLSGTFRYAEHRRFALASTLRFLPCLMLLAAGFWGYRFSQEDHLAGCIFAALTDSSAADAQMESTAQIRLLASSPERVRRKVLELVFADEKNARQAKKWLPNVLYAYLRLDPSGERRKHFWQKIAGPALKRDSGSDMALLAADAFEMAPGVDADETGANARNVVDALLSAIKKEPDGQMDWDLPEKIASLLPYFDAALAGTQAEALLKEMEEKVSLRSRVCLAKGLEPLAGQLSEDQIRRVVGALVGARVRNGDYQLSGGSSNYQTFVSRLSPHHAGSLSDEIVAAMAVSTDSDRLEELSRAIFWMVKRLDAAQSREVAKKLAAESLRQPDPLRMAWLAGRLGLVAAQAEGEGLRRVIRKLVNALEEAQDISGSWEILNAVDDLRNALDADQGRRAAQVVFRWMVQEKDWSVVMKRLLAYLGGLAPWLTAAEAQRAWEKMLEVLADESNAAGDFSIDGMADLALRLGEAQRMTLIENLIGLTRRLNVVNQRRNSVAYFFQKIAPALPKDQVLAVTERLVLLIEQEQNAQEVDHLCTLACALGLTKNADLARRAGERLLSLMENQEGIQELRDLAEHLVTIQPGTGDLQHKAAKLLIEDLNRHKDAYERNPGLLDYAAMVMDWYAGSMDPSDVQKALDAIFEISLKPGRGEPSLAMCGILESLWRKVPEKTVSIFAERVAGRVRQSASEAMGNYLIGSGRYKVSAGTTSNSEQENDRAIAEFLKYAPPQLLVDILKEPFALNPLRRIVLCALELKYDRQNFHNNLGNFVKWASGKEGPGNLDLDSPPRLNF